MPERLQDQVQYAKVILEALREGPKRWSELEKDFFKRSGSHSKFTSIMAWLIRNEYIVKDGPIRSRYPYRINEENVSFQKNDLIYLKV